MIMGIKQSNNSGTVIRDFLTNYLPQIRGMSPHTILSYRDSLKLLIKFLIEQKHISVSDLTIQNMGVNEVIDYIDFEEIMTILQTVNRSTADGFRDYALLALMFNTGARVQEIVDLKTND